MSIAVPYGDVAAMVIWVLKNDPEFRDAFPQVVAAKDLKGYTQGEQRIEVVRSGGVPVNQVLDHARIDVHCYAQDADISHDMAQQAVAAIMRAAWWNRRGFGLVLTDAHIEQGVTQLPDELTGLDRHFVSLGVYAHAHPEIPGAPEDSP